MFNTKKAKRVLALVQAYKTVFECPAGQEVLSDLAGKCGLTGYYPEARTSEAELAFWAGKRAAVLDVLRMLEYDEKRLIGILRKEINDGN